MGQLTADSPRIRRALEVLLEAIDYASETNSNRWDFAVERQTLDTFGLRPNDYRLLMCAGLTEHRHEVTLPGDNGRDFRPAGNLIFSGRSCFVLTDRGVHFATKLRATAQGAACVEVINGTENGSTTDFKMNGLVQTAPPQFPKWDPERRVLSFFGKTVKAFKWSASNQEAILSAFEEEGWPARIDDPLPPQADQDSKRRLSDTIKCLNRKMHNTLIHFRGDGTGEGVVWEPITSSKVE